MIELRKVDKNNYRRILEMKLPEDQYFVAPNVVSLAQAWVFYESARPFAIYKGEEIVGFIMLEYDFSKKEAAIWRFMIAQEHQGKGYGTKALQKAIEVIRNEKKFICIYLDYVPSNIIAKHIYEKLGFVATGEIDEGEIVMKLDL